jgi:hypothetical protein
VLGIQGSSNATLGIWNLRSMADYVLSGPSRCFPFWQEVLACYVVNTTSDDDSGKGKCAPVLEDYYECLHHKKEVGGALDGSAYEITG